MRLSPFRHRLAWLVGHPLATALLLPLLAGRLRPDQDFLRLLLVILVPLFPVLFLAPPEGGDPYRARTYRYSSALALACAALMLGWTLRRLFR